VLSATASYVQAEDSRVEAAVILTRALGPRMSTSASLSRRADRTRARIEHRYELPRGPGYGYRTSVESGAQDRSDAEFLLNTAFARYGAEMRWHEAGRGWRFQTQGAIAAIDGGLFAAREISDGFAVVDADGHDGVRVYLENREIGRTNRRGQVLVPGLRPYETNRLRIEAADLPLSVQIADPEVQVSPYYKSGTVASFGVRSRASAAMRLVTADGLPAPEGARARVDGGAYRFPVGLEGRLYLEDLAPASLIEVTGEGVDCSFRIEGLDPAAGFVELGQIVCAPSRSRVPPQDEGVR
jgi:outer membrane usher protein